MLNKAHIFGGLLSLIAFYALCLSSASATLWLKNGASVAKAEPVTVHGTFIAEHEGGVLGKTRLQCNGLTIGTVGPGAEDSGTLLENLSGTEKDLVKCVVIEGFCSQTVDHALKLPWASKLVLVGSETFDENLSGATTPESEALCNNITLTCVVKGKAKFLKNTANGAEFESNRANTQTTCSDGGTGYAVGKFTVLGFTVS